MSYIGSKRSSSLVSFDEGTIGSGVVFPAGHVIQVVQGSTTTQTVISTSTRTMTQAQINYRQALRNLPATADPQLDEDGNLTNVTWPIYE